MTYWCASNTVRKRYASHHLVPPPRSRLGAILFLSETASALRAGSLRGGLSKPVRTLSTISHLEGLARVVLVLLDTCEPPHGVRLILVPLQRTPFTPVGISTCFSGEDADALHMICITLPSATSLSRRTLVRRNLFRGWRGLVHLLPTGTSPS